MPKIWMKLWSTISFIIEGSNSYKNLQFNSKFRLGSFLAYFFEEFQKVEINVIFWF
jgi:hypothetical protein